MRYSIRGYQQDQPSKLLVVPPLMYCPILSIKSLNEMQDSFTALDRKNHINAMLTGSKKQSEERAALFTVRVHVLVSENHKYCSENFSNMYRKRRIITAICNDIPIKRKAPAILRLICNEIFDLIHIFSGESPNNLTSSLHKNCSKFR